MKKIIAALLIFTFLFTPIVSTASENKDIEEDVVIEIPTFEYTEYEYISDFYVLKDILEKNHGFLYENVSKENFNKKFNTLVSKINKNTTLNDYIYLTSEFIDYIGDGHTSLMCSTYSDKIYNSQTFLPIVTKIIDNKIYSNYNYKVIPFGSEIISIDGHKSSDILKKLSVVSGSETTHDGLAINAIESYFHGLYPLYYGLKSSYAVTYKDISDGKNKMVTLNSLDYNIDSITEFPHSSFLKGDFGINYNSLKAEFDKNSSTATLRIYNFSPENYESFTAFIDNFFNEVKTKNYTNIIFDVRDNLGGYVDLVDYILSYVYTKPSSGVYAQKINPRVFGRDYLILDPSNEGVLDNFSKYFNLSDEEKKAEDIVDFKDGTVGYVYPKFDIREDNHFDGNIYVIMNSSSFSCGSIFPQKLMELPNTTSIGTATAGNFYETTAGTLPEWTLPNTRLGISVPLSRLIIHDKKLPNIASDASVTPKHIVDLTLDDFIKGVDTQLEYTFKLINDSTKTK